MGSELMSMRDYCVFFFLNEPAFDPKLATAFELLG